MTSQKTEIFIKKSKSVHGDKYDYSLVEYLEQSKHVKIICSKHGIFTQTPKKHLHGRGCRKCGHDSRKYTTEEFVSRAKNIHKDKYDYSKSEYKNARTKICIICPEHGVFWQRPAGHLSGKGCDGCNIDQFGKFGLAITTEEFIDKSISIHGNKYSYEKSVYVEYNIAVEIICPKHGSFWQKPRDHIVSKSGCPACVHKNEGIVGEIVLDIFRDFQIIPNKKIWDSFMGYNRLRFCDFWLEKDTLKVMIEYDGEQHSRPIRFGGMPKEKALIQFENQKVIDELDKKFCEINNIVLHRISYKDNKRTSLLKLREMIDEKCCNNIWNT